MNKAVTHYWRKIRKPLILTGVVIGVGVMSYGAGTFNPNSWIQNRLTKTVESTMVSEWQAFGFQQPSIEYNNNIEFVTQLIKCIDYINLHKLHQERVHKSIITAMAVLETGWGQSRFAKEANNLFGIRTWDPKVPQLKPLELPNADFGVKKYSTKCDSVEDMINIINSHPAYEDFRVERHIQTESGKIDLDKQVNLLSKWSTNPEYTTLLKSKVKNISNILEN